MLKLLIGALLALSLHADMFSQGSTSVGLKLGSAYIRNENYTIAGLSGNYFVVDNLSVGLGYENWFSGNPNISKLTLESTYYVKASETIHPYGGVLYRRIFISDGFDDTNAYGARAGVAFVQDNLLLSAGLVYEMYEATQNFLDHSETYFELSIGLAF